MTPIVVLVVILGVIIFIGVIIGTCCVVKRVKSQRTKATATPPRPYEEEIQHNERRNNEVLPATNRHNAEVLTAPVREMMNAEELPDNDYEIVNREEYDNNSAHFEGNGDQQTARESMDDYELLNFASNSENDGYSQLARVESPDQGSYTEDMTTWIGRSTNTESAGNRSDNVDGTYDTESAQSEVYIRMLRRVPNIQNAEAEPITTMNEAYGCHLSKVYNITKTTDLTSEIATATDYNMPVTV